MDNKIIEKIKSKVNLKSKTNIVVIIGFLGVLLILLSEIPFGSNSSDSTKNKEQNSNASYIQSLETKTTEIISSINGVGKCKVMITVSQSNENVYAKNTDENNQHGYYSQNDEYVLYKGENGETPVLIKENYPKITGVAIVCDGADKIEVKKQIMDAITSLFGISSSHISISKIKQ